MPRRPKGRGTLKRSTSRGFLTLVPQVVRGGVRHLSPEGGVAVGRRDHYTKAEWHKRLRDGQAAASERLDRLLRRLDAGDAPDPRRERRTVGDEGVTWLGELETNRSRSWSVYEATWRLHVQPYPIAEVALRDLRRDHLAEWQAALARAGVGDARRAYALERVLQVLRRVEGPAFPTLTEIVKPRALRGLKPRHAPAETRPLSAAELVRLLRHGLTVPTWGPLVAACVYGKLRIGEACGLRIRDVDRFGNRLIVAQQVLHSTTELGPTKGTRARPVPVSADLIALLVEHVGAAAARGQPHGDDDLVFQTRAVRGARKGRWSPITYSVASKAFLKLGTDAGLDLGYGTHRLRHGAAMLSVAAGTSVPTIRRILGHADLRTTLTYVGHQEDELARRDAEAVGEALRPVTER